MPPFPLFFPLKFQFKSQSSKIRTEIPQILREFLESGEKISIPDYLALLATLLTNGKIRFGAMVAE